ncbi:MAG: hypothetical protein HYS18_11455 [Burkholderiales bacterium]|nr:hypothetical protein [Burkholderiales bacterium]
MYLLEVMKNALVGDKHTLAVQLMRKPWECDKALLKTHFSTTFAKQFIKLQKQCKGLLKQVKKRRLFSIDFKGLGVRAVSFLPDGQMGNLDIMAYHFVEQFAGQAREDLAEIKVSFDDFSESNQTAFVALYAFSHIGVFLLASLVVPRSSDLSYGFTSDSKIMQAYRLYWFGHQWAEQSNFSDMFMRDMIFEVAEKHFGTIERAACQRFPLFTMLVESSLDKFVSIHPDFAHLLENKDQPNYQAMYRKAELIVFLYLKSHKETRNMKMEHFNPLLGSGLPHEYDLKIFEAAGFTSEELETLLRESATAGAGDALITWSKDGKIRIGNINLKYAFNVYLKSIMTNMPTRGDWFDKSYIPAYFAKRVKSRRFAYGEGITPSNKAEGKYDVDAIVADLDAERIYLCQVKHRVTTLHPYLRDELNEFSNNGALLKALGQLEGARQQLQSEKFLEKVKGSLARGKTPKEFLDKVNQDFLKRRTGLIVLHTIENLDFAMKDGIVFYEWNTFRGLLKGETSMFSDSGPQKAKIDIGPIALDDPITLSEKLMQWHGQQSNDNPLHPERQWAISMNSSFQIVPVWSARLFGKEIGSWRGKSLQYPLL